MTSMVGALLLVSCSTPTSPAPSGATAGAKPYGSLTYGWTNVATGRLTDQTAVYAGFGSAVFDTFFRLDSEGQIIPGSIERWEVAPDGKTQTLYVRKGVKFQNGDDLTAADVKFSIERIIDPKTVHTSPSQRQFWTAQIASLELKDDYTLVIHLKQPQFELPTSLDGPSMAATAVLPKKYIEE
ncbi:MAG: ABC transporter substrate-binding protein, partial [Dehalococcoidia bacterium]|nr:ABC transporter substrate-binding protein [Dehalococcoidia bacterium]